MEEFVCIFSSSLELNTQSLGVENNMILPSTIESVGEGNLDVAVAEVLEGVPYVDPEIYAIYNELKTMFASSEFETLKSQIGSVIELSGSADDIIDAILDLLLGICAIIGFAVFIMLIPLEIWGINPITQIMVFTGAFILAIIPAILLGIVFGLFTAPLVILIVIEELNLEIDFDQLWKDIGPGGIIILFFVILPLLSLCISIIAYPAAVVELSVYALIGICYYAIKFWEEFYNF